MRKEPQLLVLRVSYEATLRSRDRCARVVAQDSIYTQEGSVFGTVAINGDRKFPSLGNQRSDRDDRRVEDVTCVHFVPSF